MNTMMILSSTSIKIYLSQLDALLSSVGSFIIVFTLLKFAFVYSLFGYMPLVNHATCL